MKHTARGWGGLAVAGLMLAAGFAATRARADDVTTLAGVTYREVRAVRVEPDGVTWEYASGMVKVDFTDLPEAVRRAYHYDAGKAAAFAAAQTQARQQADARAQQGQREAEARRAQRFQRLAEGTTTAGAAGAAAGNRPGEFVYRRSAADAAAQQAVGDGIAARRAAEDFRTKDDGTMWDRRLWAVPVFLLGGNAFNGVAFDPKTDLESHAFQGSVHHAAGGFAPDSAHDSFYQPDYMTRSYDKDVERAEAFARGRP